MKLDILPVPFLGFLSIQEIVYMVKHKYRSLVAEFEGGNPDYDAEGVVCKAPYGVLDRMGKRIMFKLKSKDFS